VTSVATRAVSAELVNEIGNQVTEIIDDDEEGDAVARDVVEKLKKVKVSKSR